LQEIGVQQKRTSDEVTILHISDLHFGWDGDVKTKDERQVALRSLLRTLTDLNEDWMPNCVCITGDIGWKGRTEDYALAAEWIRELLTTLSINAEALFLCPGNHDSDRSIAQQNVRPHDSAEADRVLGTMPIPKQYQEPFGDFASFCNSLACPPVLLGQVENHLTGRRRFKGVSFISLNTAWFCQGDDDTGKLWLGLPLLKHLETSNQLPSPREVADSSIVISLLHHPKEYLHESEWRAEDRGRPSTMDYLARRCHLILTGHTHGEVRRADRQAEGAWCLSGGAAFAGASHFNSFRLIRLERDGLVYRSFEFDPRSADCSWLPKDQPTPLPFSVMPPAIDAIASTSKQQRLTKYRSDATTAALKVIKDKSRALKKEGELPHTTTLEVLISVRGSRHFFTTYGELIPQPKNEVRVPLIAGISKARRTILLGDLGSGKSTLIANFVVETLKENDRGLAFLVPAKDIQLREDVTVKALIAALSKYFSDQISPASDEIDLECLLKDGVEISIVLDGLDELSRTRASTLLSRLGDTVDHWPTIRVIATGRPIELRGISYEDWSVLSVAPLSDDERMRLFQAEAVSDGYGVEQAKEIARRLIDNLRRQPSLRSLANTPLIVRLLYSRLSSTKGETPGTLGDILSEVLDERLGAWGSRDLKKSLTDFESEFPDASSRGKLLGRLAISFDGRRAISADEAKLQLQRLIPRYTKTNALVISTEALEYFEASGLVSISEEVQFTFQPLFEFLSGIGLGDLLQTDPSEFPTLRPEHWRAVSFLCADLRKVNLLEGAKTVITPFLKLLIQSESSVPAAAYIVTESQDSTLAEVFVEELKILGVDPIKLFYEEQVPSARAVAESLKLAKQSGFDWFYDRYLNPRYPPSKYGNMASEQVFKQWARLSIGNLDPRESALLREVVRPHIQAGSSYLMSVIPVLAMLIPEVFAPDERYWFVSGLIDDTSFSDLAEEYLQSEFSLGQAESVNTALLNRASQGYENSAQAAHLWLKLNRGRRPPVIVIRTLIRYLGYLTGYPNLNEALDITIGLMGLPVWRALLRFYLFAKEDYLSAGAAIALNRLGEDRRQILGRSLLKGIHDGIRGREAEHTLEMLIPTDDLSALTWLAEEIGPLHKDFMDSGAPSGWWRPFLSRLPNIGEAGPALLAKSIGGVGCFLFARRPEIRQFFRDLLHGPHGAAYRGELEEKLADVVPKVRHGAAMALLVCHPEDASRALDIVVNHHSHREPSWHEWRQFCLTLSFGPTVLIHLRSKLPSFAPAARVFALAVLYRGGIHLDESETGELAKGLCNLRNYGLDAEDPQLAFLAQPLAFEPLLKLVDEEFPEESEHAAQHLLRYQSDRLSAAVRARCQVLVINRIAPWTSNLYEQVQKLQSEAEYAKEIAQAGAALSLKTGKRPILDLLREAIEESQAWSEVVWRLICDNTDYRMESEDAGSWLLDFGRANPEAGKEIGKACKTFLNDPRVKNHARAETTQWLTLLADEFVGLATEDLKAAALLPASAHHSALSALLGRLGNIIPEFNVRDSVCSLPRNTPPSSLETTRSDLFQRLMDQTRDATQTHPALCDTLESFMFEPFLSEDESASLVASGKLGTLAVLSLSTAFEKPLRPREYLNLFPISPAANREEDCLSRMVALTGLGRIELLEREPTKTMYLSLLDEYLEKGKGDFLFVASELLRICRRLSIKQAFAVFTTYAETLTHYDFNLGDLLVSWLSGEIQKQEASELMDGLRRGLEILNNYHWDKSELDDAFPFLFFPAAYWRLGGPNDTVSNSVFLRGLKFLFSKRIGDLDISYPHQAMLRIEPLLSTVPRSQINAVLNEGKLSKDPVVRALCHIFCLP